MSLLVIMDREEFYRATSHGMVLVDFGAPWYAPCRLQEPILEKLASIFKGKVSFCSVNVDYLQDLAMSFQIHSIPTLIVFDQGKEIIRLIGLQAEGVLSGILDRIMEIEATEK